MLLRRCGPQARAHSTHTHTHTRTHARTHAHVRAHTHLHHTRLVVPHRQVEEEAAVGDEVVVVRRFRVHVGGGAHRDGSCPCWRTRRAWKQRQQPLLSRCQCGCVSNGGGCHWWLCCCGCSRCCCCFCRVARRRRDMTARAFSSECDEDSTPGRIGAFASQQTNKPDSSVRWRTTGNDSADAKRAKNRGVVGSPAGGCVVLVSQTTVPEQHTPSYTTKFPSCCVHKRSVNTQAERVGVCVRVCVCVGGGGGGGQKKR